MMFHRLFTLLAAALTAQTLLVATSLDAQEWKSGVDWPEPTVVVPGPTNGEPPSDAIVLFDGTIEQHVYASPFTRTLVFAVGVLQP